MKLADIIAEAHRSHDFSGLVEAIPYARVLGITVTERDGDLIARLAFDDKLIGNTLLPAIHGGVIGAFLETAAIMKLLWTRDTIHVPKTITVTIDYLRSAGPRPTFARGIITKLGARVANVRAEAWQTDPTKPVAAANANFLLPSAEE
jgi:acyl-coenzyme A thioesterase PaaI-like protein